jgi:hypothetical protein
MLQKHQRATSAIALLLVFSISQIYVQANLSGVSSSVKSAAATPARTGRLTTSGNQPVTLNGNRTHSGTTVLSGAQLQTPAGVEASVQLGRIGLLRLASETSLTLNFDDQSVDVALDSGSATLTTNEGFNGSITTPDGKTERTDPASLSTIEGPAAATVDGGDTPLFAAAVEPGQTSEREEKAAEARARRNLEACMRPAKNAYNQAVADAKQKLRIAKGQAQAAYRDAMRNAKTEAEREAALQAKRKAQGEAQEDYHTALREAQRVRAEAMLECKRPHTPATTSSDPPPHINFKGVGMLGGISNDAARAFGLVVFGGAIAASLIIVNQDGNNRGADPSASLP